MGAEQYKPRETPAGAAIGLAELGFAALTTMPVPVLLIGRAGVAFANPAAESLLSRRDGLLPCGTTSGITASDFVEAQRLRAAIVRAHDARQDGFVLISRAQPQPPLLLRISPLAESAFGKLPQPFALVVIEAGGAERGSAAEALMLMHGLTGAETEVAVAIACGDCAKRIAHRREVSVATIRHQIRQVLSKTRSRDQRDFVRRFGWITR